MKKSKHLRRHSVKILFFTASFLLVTSVLSKVFANEEASEIFRFRLKKNKSLLPEQFIEESPFSYFKSTDFWKEEPESSRFGKMISQFKKVFEPFEVNSLGNAVGFSDRPEVATQLAPLFLAMSSLGDPRFAAIFYDFVKSGNEKVQCLALQGLGQLKVPETFALLLSYAKNMKLGIQVRISSIEGLAAFGGVSAARELTEQLKIEKNDQVRLALTSALEKVGGAQGYRFNSHRVEISPVEQSDHSSAVVW